MSMLLLVPACAPPPPPTIAYTLKGLVKITNDCDGTVGSIPPQVEVTATLTNGNTSVNGGPEPVALAPDPNNPNNPVKTGTYSVTVNWDTTSGAAPTKWTNISVRRVGGGSICTPIPCPPMKSCNILAPAR